MPTSKTYGGWTPRQAPVPSAHFIGTFFQHLKETAVQEYKDLIAFDELLEKEQPNTKITSKLYISRSRKRIKDLLPEECNDAEYFLYKGQQVWNGF